MSDNLVEMQMEAYEQQLKTPEVLSSAESCDGCEENVELPEPKEVSSRSPQSKDNDCTLLQLVRNRNLKSKYICNEWINGYGINRDATLIILMEFFLEASGSQYKLPKGLEQPFDHWEILITATSQFGNKSSAYPLTLKTAHVFAEDISKFIAEFLRRVGATPIISDDFFIKTISDFLMVCSNSKVRAFRHTGTLIALKFMTGLNGLTIAQESQKKLKDIWQQMFAKIFSERTTDVVDEIRYLCIAECGLWLEKYPNSFVNEHHVKYLCQALQDSCSKVSEASLTSLLQLHQKEELQSICLLHITKYRMTLLGQCMSSECELAQMAIKLMIMIKRLAPQILDDSMIQVIEQLVFASHRGIAQAASEVITFRYQNASTDKERLLILVQFFLESSDQEHAAYLVDAFYGHNYIIVAHNTMLSMLLQPISMSFKETSVLIEIMTRSIKQAVTGEIPVGRYVQDLERQPRPQARKKITKILLPKLPILLQQYRNCNDDLRNLLELPMYMMLEGAQLWELLNQFIDILFVQKDMSVLQMAAMTLEHIYGLNAAYAEHRSDLLNTAVSNYMNAWNDDNPERLRDTLRLLSALYAHFDLHDWKLDDHFLGILEVAKQKFTENIFSNETLALYLSVFYLSLSWDLKRVQQLAEAGEDVANDCQTLRNHFKYFLLVNFELIRSLTGSPVVCDAFVYSCDMFVLFADSLRKSPNAAIRHLEYKSKKSDYDLLEQYVLSYVFAGAAEGAGVQLLEQEHFDELQSKRRVLSSYLKLTFHNLMPMMRSCVVFQYYEQYHPVFGDLMRATMERCLAMNPTNFGMTVMHTCLLAYKRLRETYPDYAEANSSAEFAKLLKLANLLAEVFHIKPLAARKGILILHRAGINFAGELTSNDDPDAAPKDLLYLTVMQQFVPQLLAQDLLDVLHFMQFINQSPLRNCPDEWKPLLSYRSTLEVAVRKSCRRDDFPDFTAE